MAEVSVKRFTAAKGVLHLLTCKCVIDMAMIQSSLYGKAKNFSKHCKSRYFKLS